MSKYGVISGLYFPVFGRNTEIYFVNLHIQSEHRKIQARNNSAFGRFSRSAFYKHGYRLLERKKERERERERAQLTFSSPKSTIKALEKGVKYVQS